jgi:8-oxo-dGTP diphosphatase
MSSQIHVAVDAVVFGYADKQLKLLLIRRNIAPFEGEWALPGGLVLPDESLEAAVARELREETGLEINYLEQLYTFGRPDRDPRNRVVSVAYFALVNPNQFQLAAATDASEAQWFPVRRLPALAFDHAEIVQYAHQRLRNKLTYEPIGLNLLDPEFRFSDLENLYETILERKFERRNFRKKFLGFDILEETSILHSGKKGRPGTLFRFNVEKYKSLKARGMVFEIS